MGKYDRCPNCGNIDEAKVYRCSDCGKTSTSLFNWMVGQIGGRCPACNSNDVSLLGTIGDALFRFR